METQTALDIAIDHCGTQQALADALGIQSPSISEWKSRGRVPAERCRAIQDATGGRVTVHELRPDVFGPPPPPANDPEPPAPGPKRIDTPEAVTRLLGVSPAPAAAPLPPSPLDPPPEPKPEVPGDSVVVPFEAPP